MHSQEDSSENPSQAVNSVKLHLLNALNAYCYNSFDKILRDAALLHLCDALKLR